MERLLVIIIWIAANLVVQINSHIDWLNVSDVGGGTIAIRWSRAKQVLIISDAGRALFLATK